MKNSITTSAGSVIPKTDSNKLIELKSIIESDIHNEFARELIKQGIDSDETVQQIIVDWIIKQHM